MGIRYNIIEEPWIPVLDSRRDFKLTSLLDVLINARDYIEFQSPNPLIEVSLYRFLLAILHRTFGPENAEKWREIHDQGKFNEKVLHAYFNDNFDRFELFGAPETRFYQFPFESHDYSFLKKKNKLKLITRLDYNISSGNTAAFNDLTFDLDEKALPVEKVVRLLLAYQNYSRPGGNSKPFNFASGPLYPSMIGLIKGNSLFETLMLNLIEYNDSAPFEREPSDLVGKDKPFWERTVEERVLYDGKEGRKPAGYLDYLTWQSKRIFLFPERTDSDDIVVRHMLFLQGEKVHSDFVSDPQRIYRISKTQQKSRYRMDLDKRQGFQPDLVKAICELIEELEDNGSVDSENRALILPRAINCLHFLLTQEKYSFHESSNPNLKISLHALENDVQNVAKVIDTGHFHVLIPKKIFIDGGVREAVKEFALKFLAIKNALLFPLILTQQEILFPEKKKLRKSEHDLLRNWLANTQIEFKFHTHSRYEYQKFLVELEGVRTFHDQMQLVEKYVERFMYPMALKFLNQFKRTLKGHPTRLLIFQEKEGLFFQQLREKRILKGKEHSRGTQDSPTEEEVT